MRVTGLFSGIGGFEIGFEDQGFHTDLLCELDPAAVTVLKRRFPDTPLIKNVRELESLPPSDVVTAGFPCQNLSLVGTNEGIFGKHSSLIEEVFRLVKGRPGPRWLLLENVPFMLRHKKGHAIRYVTEKLEDLGFRWAYRVVDTRAFGLPQRRRRVFILASRTDDPRDVLFADQVPAPAFEKVDDVPSGFYWTEGRGGLGWAVNAVPTIKAGSGVGIPSPPAIWLPGEDRAVTPHVQDAERLQGFPAGWTAVEVEGKPVRAGVRWRMVGNAVSVPVASWLASRLKTPGRFDHGLTREWTTSVWPHAAWGEDREVYPVEISEWPVREHMIPLRDFLRFPEKELSARATAGFLKRARSGSLNFVPGFLESLDMHLGRMSEAVAGD